MVSARFPQDLIELQRSRNRAYEELAGRPVDVSAARRRLLWLSARLFWHPLFDASTGGSPAARVAAQAGEGIRRSNRREPVRSGQQERILRAAREFLIERGEPPTMRQLADAVGLSSTSTVSYHLQQIRERGLTVETRGKATGRCPLCGQ